MTRRWLCVLAVLILAPALVCSQQGVSERAGPSPSTPKADPGHPRRVRVTESLSRGLLIKKVDPEYPGDVNIEGSVVLKAVIDKTGKVRKLKVISGHPLLVPSAMDAARQWRYMPWIFNGEVVEMETQITVGFPRGASSSR